ncbi:MAG TPA: peptidoglycan-binding domain-containing protein [Candidatus Acidoferrum sp.]|nr:peptidoglycan-binding domain-containing protein [Candidatus Acidoferrum sp.]
MLKNRRTKRLLLAAVAVGSLVLPAAVSAQSSAANKATHKPTSKPGSLNTASSGTKKSAHSGKSSSRSKSKRVKGQAAPSPERINEIQDVLAKKGFYTDAPSGKWDDSTTEAMKKFQSSHGLNPTGKFDALTLQKLGLGSETAGLGAPTPPPNAVANRLLSSKVQRDEIKNEPE